LKNYKPDDIIQILNDIKPKHQINTGMGLKKMKNKYIQLGKRILIDKEKLIGRGLLSIGELTTSNNRRIKPIEPYLKNQYISDNYKNILTYILEKQQIPDLSLLKADERDHLYKLIAKSKLELDGANKDLIKQSKEELTQTKRITSMQHRFRVLYGSIQAGNENNPKVKKELLSLMERMLRYKILTPDIVEKIRAQLLY